MTITLETTGTHLYPGARGTVRDGPPPSQREQRPTSCLILFTDGTAAAGTLSPRGVIEWLLAVDAHRTGRGTTISSKCWIVVFDRTVTPPSLRVRSMCPPA
ncbi:hypothetical protein ABNQ38_30980 [Azospirillum sp. A29]|jgi:hypothetical protein|uniref:hypothetical protein n=1 Tax=Azospirillum sp. A29 TaxID=3160606 RepID=UPI0036735E73